MSKNLFKNKEFMTVSQIVALEKESLKEGRSAKQVSADCWFWKVKHWKELYRKKSYFTEKTCPLCWKFKHCSDGCYLYKIGEDCHNDNSLFFNACYSITDALILARVLRYGAKKGEK